MINLRQKKFKFNFSGFGLIFLIILFHSIRITAQASGEMGKPIITSYSCKDNGLNVQVFDLLEDNRGMIYAGSAPGVFEFDGSSWRLIFTENKTHARSMAVDSNNRIYVGASADFGYLKADEKGLLSFVSLLNQFKESDRNATYVWTTNIIGNDIYFQSFEGIYRVTPVGNNQWKTKLWKPKVRFNYAFYLKNTYYVQQGGVGLMKMVDGSLQLLPGGEQFAQDRLQVMLPYNKDGKELILVGTFNRGLFLFDGNTFEPFNCEASEYFKQTTLYKAKQLNDGSYAMITLSGGFVVMNKEGKIVLLLNKKKGLSSDNVTALTVDRKNLVWMAPEGTVASVEYPSPITIFDHSEGLTSSIQDMVRYKGILYFATSNGVCYLDANSSSIMPVTGFNLGNSQSFQCVLIQDQLLITQGTGLYSVNDKKASLIKAASGLAFVPNFVHRSRLDTNRIFVGTIDGLTTFHKEKNNWLYDGRIKGVEEYCVNILEVKPGILLYATDNKGLLHIDYRGNIFMPQVELYGTNKGLPNGGTYLYSAIKKTLVIFSDAIYEYDEDSRKFTRFTRFDSKDVFDNSYIIFTEEKNNLWVSNGKQVALYELQPDGKYKMQNNYTSRLSNDPILKIYPDGDGVVWFGSANYLYRLNKNAAKMANEKFETFVRKVVVDEDSVIFAGSYIRDVVPKINYASNSILFQFSATSLVDPTATMYKTILSGFDDKWSDWKKDTYRNYTNLPPGDYSFKVIAKNLYQVEGKAAMFSFTVRPPWYRAWWAYVSYFLFLAVLVLGVDRLQRKRLTKRMREKTRLREIELRAEKAETESKLLQLENDRRKNIELLSEMGKEITASLDLDIIFFRLYEYVNQLADATIFGVGIYHPDIHQIEYRLALESGKRYPPYSRNTQDKNQFPVWCIEHKKPVFINDVTIEYKNYIQFYKEPERVLEDGTLSKEPLSLIYLPLISKENVLGVITIQSFQKNAYSEYHLNILQNLASYSSIAIDNADAYKKLDSALIDLKATQEKLVVQEKLASLGQLTAGIAHEIKNPLNFVNNFAQLSKEMIEEIHEEFNKVKGQFSKEFTDNFEELLANIDMNVTKTNEHGKRADSIVRSMLQHSRGKSGDRIESDINAIVEEDLNLAYHGLRARDSSFNITIEKYLDPELDKLSIVPQDVSRVFLNIINNGFYEANKKKKNLGNNFMPVLQVKTVNCPHKIEVRIRDNGNGISPEVGEKLFNPFFTTKPAGEGTGLGLSLSHDIIVKQHGGEINFITEPGEYTEFIISLPKNGKS